MYTTTSPETKPGSTEYSLANRGKCSTDNACSEQVSTTTHYAPTSQLDVDTRP